MRTFSREAFLEARAAWDGGEFGPEWGMFRNVAGDRGYIYPPAGTRWDSWEDDQPSQRAIIHRAIEETPKLLVEVMRQSNSWSNVIARLTQRRDAMREDANVRDQQDGWDRKDELTPRQATQTILGILERVWESRP